MICPFCAEKIKNEAIVCRHCGRDIPKKNGTESVVNQTPVSSIPNDMKSTFKKKQIQIFAVILALFGLVGIYFVTQSESANIAACKAEVSQYLKQPSTAEWQSMSESEQLDSDAMIVFEDGSKKKDSTAIVLGSVRSQNAFGAMITTNFKCSKPVWEDYWDVETWEDGDSAP
jgi:uncharacterized membrane protein YvbJ